MVLLDYRPPVEYPRFPAVNVLIAMIIFQQIGESKVNLRLCSAHAHVRSLKWVILLWSLDSLTNHVSIKGDFQWP